MPVLEAMAAGTPVVCTLSESAFAKHAFNCLVAAPLEVPKLNPSEHSFFNFLMHGYQALPIFGMQ